MHLTCPTCGFSRDIPEDKIPATAKVATCPKCGEKFNFRDPAPVQEPPAPTSAEETRTPPPQEEDFGSPLSDENLLDEYDDEQETPAYLEPLEDEPASETFDDVPWERLDKYGVPRGFIATVTRVMLSPARFFQTMPMGGFGKPLVFYIIVAELQVLVQLFWAMLGVGSSLGGEESVGGFGGMGMSTLLFVLATPFFLTIGIFLGSGIMHLCLRIVRAASQGYEGTFRAVSYGYAPMVLGVIPVVGPIIGVIWAMVTTIIGYMAIHSAGLGRVLMAFGVLIGLTVVVSLALVSCSSMAVP